MMVDASMVQTDAGETCDLLTSKLAADMLLLGVLPAWLVWRVPLAWCPLSRKLVFKLALICGWLLRSLLTALLYYRPLPRWYATIASCAGC